MTWRVTVATVLLLAGASCVASAQPWYVVVLGLLMLMFVPALIVDEARAKRRE